MKKAMNGAVGSFLLCICGISLSRHIAKSGSNIAYDNLLIMTAPDESPTFTVQLIHCIMTDIPENSTTAAVKGRLPFAAFMPRVISITPRLTALTVRLGKKNNTLCQNSTYPIPVKISAINPKNTMYPQMYRQELTEFDTLLHAASVRLITPWFV